VRALLAILVEKGHARYRTEGPKYVYSPMEPVVNARQGALRRLIKTFFGGSTLSAANALLGMGASSLEEEELDQLARLIERERAKRRE
jgi:predicted transcriptional regulator